MGRGGYKYLRRASGAVTRPDLEHDAQSRALGPSPESGPAGGGATQPQLLPVILIIRGHLASGSTSEQGPARTLRLGGAPAHGRRSSPAQPALPLRAQEVVGARGRPQAQGAWLPFSQRAPHKSVHTTPGPGDRAASPRSHHEPDTQGAPNQAEPQEGLPALQHRPRDPAPGCPRCPPWPHPEPSQPLVCRRPDARGHCQQACPSHILEPWSPAWTANRTWG